MKSSFLAGGTRALRHCKDNYAIDAANPATSPIHTLVISITRIIAGIPMKIKTTGKTCHRHDRTACHLLSRVVFGFPTHIFTFNLVADIGRLRIL